MAYDTNQEAIQLGRLYKVSSMGEQAIEQDLSASIWINSGSVDLYGSDSTTQPASLSEMTLNIEDTGLSGKVKVETLTNYIAVVQNVGTSTEIVLSGIDATKDLGAIS